MEVIIMCKLPEVSYKEFTTALKANGFKPNRSKGGHEVWEKTITQSVSIPIHGDINGALARRLDKELKLNDCKVLFILLDNGEQIRKKATVENDIISTCIDAIDTLNKDTLSYECRAFGQGGEVYHVALGNIFIIKSKVPVIEYEEE